MKNYHTHTTRCMHAIGSEEEYILAAISAGYTELGFSDHTLSVLRDKYKDKISIKIGLECEYFEDKMDWLKEQVERYGLDYLILGNHFDGSDETGIYYGYPVSLEELKRYVSQVLKAMDTGLFSYVAHPDVVFYDESKQEHIDELEKVCIHAAEINMPLEFNLLGYKAMRHYPSQPFIDLCKKHHNRIIIGTDAHDAGALKDTQTYNRAYTYLKENGLEITEDIKMLK